MATVTWRGITGAWTSGLSWQSLQPPGSLDTAFFADDASTAELTAGAGVGSIVFAQASQTTLLVQAALSLGGVLALTAGTLDLAAGGTIEGGTVDLAGGAFIGAGGIADGVVWLGALGNGLAITAATAAATQAASAAQTLAISGALTLETGTYDGAHFVSATYQQPSQTLDVAAGGTVTFAGTTTLFASADDPANNAGVSPTYSGLTLGGDGVFVNDAEIVSDLTVNFVPLTIASSAFDNAGILALNAAVVPDVQQVFTVQQGRIPQNVTLTFDQTFAPGLIEAATSFTNTGTILGQAASMEVTGATFENTGTISLGSVQATTPIVTPTQAYVGTITLGSTLDITAGVTSFSNTGTISASDITFDDNLTLGQLGLLDGDVVMNGTLDLGGGTLDVGKLDPTGSFTFTGTVLNGTLISDGGILVTTAATLDNVTILSQAPGVVLDVTSGNVTLDATTVELAYTTPASVDDLNVTAGVLGTTDLIGARAPGTLTFGAATTIADTVAGSTLEIGGQGTFSDAGQITLDGSTLGIATLDGTGTISLSGSAVLQIGELASTAALTIDFGSGNNLLSLPSDSSGVNALGLTLVNLQAGDEIDFTGVSSNPPAGTFGNPGAGIQNGTLDVQGASGDQASVALAGNAGNLDFTVSSDPSGGTLVTVSCFRRGTRIATPAGEVPVEQLRIGDLVHTVGGGVQAIKWLGRRSYRRELVANQPQLRPVRLEPGSLGHHRPLRTLYLSPLHGLLLNAPDGSPVLVPAASLVNGTTIRRARIAAVSYVHVELDRPDAVWAEGAPAETFVDCDSRALFENAAEFDRLYPAACQPRWEFFAPRVEDGDLLEAVRTSLPGRRPPPARHQSLRWHIDHQDEGRLEGWVCSQAASFHPVEFEVVVDSRRIARALANGYRVDLDRAGLRQGRCAFNLDLAHVDPAILRVAELRAIPSGQVLTR